MRKDEPITSIELDLAGALARVGDSQRIRGSARIVAGDSYELTFLPGDNVAWSVEVRRITGAVVLTGDLSGTVTLQCYRCLESFEYPLDIRLRENALWLSEEDVEPGDDFADEYEVMDGTLDLLPVLRDAICLAFPVKRICSEACRGLCTACGSNLNIDPCECDTTRIDARLRPLEGLKKRMEERDT